MTRRITSAWARIHEYTDSVVRCLLLGKRMLALAIKDDLDTCEAAGKRLRLDDKEAKERNRTEYNLLMSHLKWVRRESHDQAALEKIVRSLETNDALHAYQGWRERGQSSEFAEAKRRRKAQGRSNARKKA